MKDILTEAGHRDGMTVPDGYFADFAARMAASLPERDWERTGGVVAPRSIWQKTRAYVYMAAMFLGVWLMMNMFTLFRPAAASQDNSAVFASAVSDEQFMNDYMAAQGMMDDYVVLEDLYDQGFDPVDFDTSSSPHDNSASYEI